MKILFVASHNTGKFSTFITEQAEALQKLGVEIDYFGVVGKGILGYLNNRKKLILKIREFQPDLIHAHYGLSGLLANLQRKIKVVVTYHGCDINKRNSRILSVLSILLSKHNIFVSKKLMNCVKFYVGKKYDIVPCGIDKSVF